MLFQRCRVFADPIGMIPLPPGVWVGAAGTVGGGAFKWLAARHNARAEQARTRRLTIHACITAFLAVLALVGAIVLR